MINHTNSKIRNIPRIILCDFDGTVTKNDITDEILNKFSVTDWQLNGEKYDAKLISHFTMNREFVNSIRCTPIELTDYLDSKKWLREGFLDFVKKCRDSEITLCIISSGWNLYIQNILSGVNSRLIQSMEDFESISLNGDEVPIICNKIKYISDGRWKLEENWNLHSCSISTPCKGRVFESLSNSFEIVHVIGNSSTDMCMVEKAKHTYATGSLTKLCLNKDLKFNNFNSFNEINIPKIYE